MRWLREFWGRWGRWGLDWRWAARRRRARSRRYWWGRGWGVGGSGGGSWVSWGTWKRRVRRRWGGWGRWWTLWLWRCTRVWHLRVVPSSKCSSPLLISFRMGISFWNFWCFWLVALCFLWFVPFRVRLSIFLRARIYFAYGSDFQICGHIHLMNFQMGIHFWCYCWI